MFMFGLGTQELVFLLFLLAIPVVILVFWIWTLIDIIKNEFTGSNKVIWILVVLFLPVLGMILYYFIGRQQKIKKIDASPGDK